MEWFNNVFYQQNPLDMTYIGQLMNIYRRLIEHESSIRQMSLGNSDDMFDANIFYAFEQGQEKYKNVKLIANLIKVPAYLLDDLEMASISAMTSMKVPILNNVRGAGWKMFAKFKGRYNMDAEEVIAVGKFITFGFPHGNKCTIKSLKNGQSNWERMPMLTS